METRTLSRTDRLLTAVLLQLMKGEPQRDKILQLNLAGLSNVEIADMLETTPAVVSQSIYEARKVRKKARPAKRHSASRE